MPVATWPRCADRSHRRPKSSGRFADYRAKRLGSTDGSGGITVTDHGITPINARVASIRSANRPDTYGQPLPAEPPAALHEEYTAAAKVIEDLASQQINLHFEIDESTNRVHVQMLNQDGHVIREIPARSLLDSLSGGGLLIDERG
jgi:uncharacterized FlaG/YvyC family protein